MPIYSEEDIREHTVINVAEQMMIAARTAPKGRGADNIILRLLHDASDITALQDKMRELGEKNNLAFFKRDAENLNHAQAIVILGTRIKPMGLGKACQMCGYESCEDKPLDVPCVFNTGDLGIALGSAISIAADHRVDNRIMYTIGQAALELGILTSEAKIAYGIPLSVSSKNPFYDRQQKK